MNWQSNLRYLKQRNKSLALLTHVLHVRREQERETSAFEEFDATL